MSMRIALDSVSYAAVGPVDWPDKIGYFNGRISAWTPEEIAESRRRGQLIALVDVLGNAFKDASILDWERGDVQSPAVLHAWVQARNQYRGDATVYCARSSVPTVVAALRGEKCNLWVCSLTDSGEPPLIVPDFGELPHNVRVVAVQYVLAPRSGGDYDMSIIYAEDWHPERDDDDHAARATAAVMPGTTSPAAAVDALAQVNLPAAPAAATAASTAEQYQSTMYPAATSAAAAPLANAAAWTAEPTWPTPAPPVPIAPSRGKPPLNHDYIGSVMRDVRAVAGMFRNANVPVIAGVLEQAAAHAVEIGQALKLAGL